MVKTIHTMHAIAERTAIQKGPRVVRINGHDRAAYYLSKPELAKLFSLNGYNTDRISWLKYIIEWKRTWEELGPSDSRILDETDQGWNIVFLHVSEFDKQALRMFGENNDLQALVIE